MLLCLTLTWVLLCLTLTWVQVRGILDEQEALLARQSQVLLSTHVCIATPRALADALQGEDCILSLLAAAAAEIA